MRLLNRNRLRAIAGSLVGAVGGIGLAAALWPVLVDTGDSVARALVLLVPAGVVFALSLGVALSRFITQVVDPLANTATPRPMGVIQRTLTNSLEQGFVFAAAGAALLSTNAPWAPGAAAVLAVTFGLGRVAFLLGYLHSTFGRGPGMAATFLANAGAIGLTVYGLVT